MTVKKELLFLIAIVFNLVTKAQESAIYTGDLVNYQKALQLYHNKQYLGAQNVFSQVKKTTTKNSTEGDCAFYIANCAVRLNQQNADRLMERFVENYPTSTKRNSAFIDVADYYFENGKYAHAQKWYKKVGENALSREEKEKYHFNNGYASFIANNYKEAKNYLSRVETSEKYGAQAKYYIGYMAYEGDDYDKANQYFDQVSNKDKYKEKLSYYQADLNFKLGKFDEAIRLAKEQLEMTKVRNEVSELNKIVGESLFNQEKFAEALPYLKAYKGQKGRWTNTDYYQLGYTYYKQEKFNKAISEFSKIIDGDNSIAQNAYYHLGESYVKSNKKQEALNAFRNASQMNYDVKIQEDAWLNYAKLSYEIGNAYQSVPQVLSDYLEKYPETSYKQEIETLLIDSYVTSKNYKEALELLKKGKGFENKAIYQKVAFYRGLELYNESKFQEAKELFNSSLKEQHEANYTARATFWKAETDYNLANYDEALIGFKQFEKQTSASATREFKNLDYNLAYTYFKQKAYSKSLEHFNQFISKHTDDKIRLNDAYLRLADGYFVSSNYTQAIKAYENAIQTGDIEADYAFFQQAMSHGYLGENNKKNNELETFLTKYPESKLRDDALYALGNSYVKSGQISKGMQLYDRLASEYSTTSPFVSKSLLRQGLSYYNTGNNEKALNKFKRVAADFPSTPEANQSVSSARLIYIDLGQVEAYAAWVKTLDYIEITDADLDNATYEAAEKQYLDANTNDAIKQFNKYLNQFPNGLHTLSSHFYLAQLYYQKDLPENAQPHFKYVIESSQSEFTEEALLRLSQITLEKKNWEAVIPFLKRLEEEANFPQNTRFAQSNLMQAYYQLKQYDEAEDYAEKIVANTNLDNKIKTDAYLIIARSAMLKADEKKAKNAYEIVEANATGEAAAEALYYNAYFKNKAKDYEGSNKITQRLAKDYSGYKYYGAKGLVIMAKNFNSLGDAFQATYILESVIKNFSSFKEVVSEAKDVLKMVKTEQSKTNSSVQPEN